MSQDGIEHQHDVGEVFEAPQKGVWKVTNRMVDVDTEETLYRLRQLDTDFNDTEILSETQIERIYKRDHAQIRGEEGDLNV